MRDNKWRQVIATTLVFFTTGIIFMGGLRHSNFSLFGTSNDFSLGILVGFVAGAGIGLAVLLSRKCKPANQ